jgi:hypothetical protein
MPTTDQGEPLADQIRADSDRQIVLAFADKFVLS